jgi:hypothetical protein
MNSSIFHRDTGGVTGIPRRSLSRLSCMNLSWGGQAHTGFCLTIYLWTIGIRLQRHKSRWLTPQFQSILWYLFPSNKSLITNESRYGVFRFCYDMKIRTSLVEHVVVFVPMLYV